MGSYDTKQLEQILHYKQEYSILFLGFGQGPVEVKQLGEYVCPTVNIM